MALHGVLVAIGRTIVKADSVEPVAVSHESLHSMLKFEEGYREKIYLDTKNIPTGGIGHAFQVGSKLPDKIWRLIFAHDVEQAWRKFELLNLNHLSKRRQWVCVAMIFQLGFDGFRGFKRTRRYLRQGNYKEAAMEMLRSKWYKEDTPERALRMSQVMLEG